ncbi:MAG: hypothetical protein PHF67_01745 [Candidatus Nanoarchaeia archaeon]|nr:hypothetical protein [Candidatus Nanoarchaeia archaeon]
MPVQRLIFQCSVRPQVFYGDVIYVFPGRDERDICIASLREFGYRDFLNSTSYRIVTGEATNLAGGDSGQRVSRKRVLRALLEENPGARLIDS